MVEKGRRGNILLWNGGVRKAEKRVVERVDIVVGKVVVERMVYYVWKVGKWVGKGL